MNRIAARFTFRRAGRQARAVDRRRQLQNQPLQSHGDPRVPVWGFPASLLKNRVPRVYSGLPSLDRQGAVTGNGFPPSRFSTQ